MKLKPGMYVATSELSDFTFHAVAHAFMHAGANKMEYAGLQHYGAETVQHWAWFGWALPYNNNVHSGLWAFHRSKTYGPESTQVSVKDVLQAHAEQPKKILALEAANET